MKTKSIDMIYYVAAGVVAAAALFVCAVLLAAWYAYALVVLAVAAAVTLRILRKAYGVRSIFVWAALFAAVALSLTVCRSDMAVSLSADYYRSFTRFFMFGYNAATGETYFGKTLSVQAPDYEFGQWRAPRGYSNAEIGLPHARGFLLKKEGGAHDRVVYQIHGGGFVSKFADTYNETAVLFSATYGGADVFSLDYRTAPDDPYPAALDDAADGYRYLLDAGYAAENVIVAGDSAGGGLALSLTLKLRDEGAPLPAGLILSSPFTDHTASGGSYKTNATKDVFFGGWNADNVPVPLLKPLYAGGRDPTDPYLSPAFGDYRGMPPALIIVGSDEMLLGDSETVAGRMRAAGRDVTLSVYHGMYHTFNIVTPAFPESRAAWKETAEFVNRLINT